MIFELSSTKIFETFIFNKIIDFLSLILYFLSVSVSKVSEFFFLFLKVIQPSWMADYMRHIFLVSPNFCQTKKTEFLANENDQISFEQN